MDEKTPFEKLLDDMNDLLQLLKDGMAKGPPNEELAPLDVDNRLRKLEKDVELFEKKGRETVELSGLASAELRKYSEGMVDDLLPEGKELMEKAARLQKQADALEESYKTGILPQEIEKKPVLSDAEAMKQRRKKFKRLGSNDKWKPL